MKDIIIIIATPMTPIPSITWPHYTLSGWTQIRGVGVYQID